jgi:hypothetical protein
MGKKIMKNHTLYTAEDFRHMTGEEMEQDKLAEMVLDAGLDICKVCGEYEAGLDRECVPMRKGF